MRWFVTVIGWHLNICLILSSSSHSRGEMMEEIYYVILLSPLFSLSLSLLSLSLLIFKASPKIQVILAAVLHLEIWKTLWVPWVGNHVGIWDKKLKLSFLSPAFFLSSNILSRFIFKGPGTLDRKTSGLFQGAGRLPDQQCKYVVGGVLDPMFVLPFVLAKCAFRSVLWRRAWVYSSPY